MQARIKTASALGAKLSALGLLTSACAEPGTASGYAPGRVGQVSLALQLAQGVSVSAIEYEISGDAFRMSGQLEVDGAGTTFGATLGAIPAGTGHRIVLRSRADGDAGLGCAGEATFDIEAGASTRLPLLH